MFARSPHLCAVAAAVAALASAGSALAAPIPVDTSLRYRTVTDTERDGTTTTERRLIHSSGAVVNPDRTYWRIQQDEDIRDPSVQPRGWEHVLDSLNDERDRVRYNGSGRCISGCPAYGGFKTSAPSEYVTKSTVQSRELKGDYNGPQYGAYATGSYIYGPNDDFNRYQGSVSGDGGLGTTSAQAFNQQERFDTHAYAALTDGFQAPVLKARSSARPSERGQTTNAYAVAAAAQLYTYNGDPTTLTFDFHLDGILDLPSSKGGSYGIHAFVGVFEAEGFIFQPSYLDTLRAGTLAVRSGQVRRDESLAGLPEFLRNRSGYEEPDYRVEAANLFGSRSNGSFDQTATFSVDVESGDQFYIYGRLSAGSASSHTEQGVADAFHTLTTSIKNVDGTEPVGLVSQSQIDDVINQPGVPIEPLSVAPRPVPPSGGSFGGRPPRDPSDPRIRPLPPGFQPIPLLPVSVANVPAPAAISLLLPGFAAAFVANRRRRRR